MKYIVYETVCLVNRKIYIGVHKTSIDEFDGYLGNGVYVNSPSTYMHPKFAFQFAVKKYGPKNFIRTTIKEFDNEEEAYKLEAYLVNEDFLKREDVYNVTLGGRSAEQANGKKKIYMYSLSGEFEMEFESLRDAVKHLNPEASGGGHLPRAIKKGHQFLGHQFSYEKVPCMKALKSRIPHICEKPHLGKPVGRFDDFGNLLETFVDVTECRKAGYSNVKEVLRGKRAHCKGFIFKYLD